MIDPEFCDIGRNVIYRDLGGQKTEQGTVTSFNIDYVFVRYGWGGSTSAATRREDLEWSRP